MGASKSRHVSAATPSSQTNSCSSTRRYSGAFVRWKGGCGGPPPPPPMRRARGARARGRDGAASQCSRCRPRHAGGHHHFSVRVARACGALASRRGRACISKRGSAASAALALAVCPGANELSAASYFEPRGRLAASTGADKKLAAC